MTILPDDITPHSAIAKNLARLMAQENLNANQLSEKLTLPMMTIRRLLLGETQDPRISTLKLIASYFNISIDVLLNEPQAASPHWLNKNQTYQVPKLEWRDLPEKVADGLTFSAEWKNWQPLAIKNENTLSPRAFALDSRPSMYARFPKGTCFIISPDAEPEDGDWVLVEINNEFTLKGLTLDPPESCLVSLTNSAKTLPFVVNTHKIVGVVILSLLYCPRIND